MSGFLQALNKQIHGNKHVVPSTNFHIHDLGLIFLNWCYSNIPCRLLLHCYFYNFDSYTVSNDWIRQVWISSFFSFFKIVFALMETCILMHWQIRMTTGSAWGGNFFTVKWWPTCKWPGSSSRTCVSNCRSSPGRVTGVSSFQHSAPLPTKYTHVVSILKTQALMNCRLLSSVRHVLFTRDNERCARCETHEKKHVMKHCGFSPPNNRSRNH